MAESNKNKHLTHEERKIIEFGIRSGATQKAIADTIGKQKSTVGKEIKNHRKLTYKCKLPVECADYAKCKPGHKCIGAKCPKFVQFKCQRRDRSPGVHATAVKHFSTADSINISIKQMMLNTNTVKHWSTAGSEQIC